MTADLAATPAVIGMDRFEFHSSGAWAESHGALIHGRWVGSVKVHMSWRIRRQLTVRSAIRIRRELRKELA